MRIISALRDCKQGSLTVSKKNSNCKKKLSGTSVWRPQSRYTVLRIECRITFPQNQRCRAKIALHPPQNQGVAPFSGPPCRTFLAFAASRGSGGLVEGIAALLGSKKRIALQMGIAATVAPVALLCATKRRNRCKILPGKSGLLGLTPHSHAGRAEIALQGLFGRNWRRFPPLRGAGAFPLLNGQFFDLKGPLRRMS